MFEIQLVNKMNGRAHELKQVEKIRLMPIILLTNSYSKAPLDILNKELPNGFELISLNEANKKELIEKAGKADYLLVSGRIPIDKDVIDASTRLKMIQRTGVGVDTIDTKALKERGIPVYVNTGINSYSVAEHTLMLILAVLRKLPAADASVRRGTWLKQELGIQCNELRGKTVGLVGLGSIGTEVAKLLNAFNATVLYSKPSKLSDVEERELHLEYRSLPQLLREVDILSLHLPLNAKTRNLIGHKEISQMKKGAIIINTSRGQLINEEALITALKSGHLKGAGLDVYSTEPLPASNPLTHLENVVLTPHIAGITSESFQRMMGEAMTNIKVFHEGKIEMIESKRLEL